MGSDGVRHAILVLDDEPDVVKTVQDLFRYDYKVFGATNARAALAILEKEPIAAIITDHRMPEISGVKFLNQIRTQYPEIIGILFTAFADIQTVIEAINHGNVFRYIVKPWNLQEFRTVVREACQRHEMIVERRILIEQLRQRNEDLQKSHELARRHLAELEQVYEYSPVGLCIVDQDFRYIRINKLLAEINGASVEAHIGRTCRDMIPLLADTVEGAFGKVLQTGQPVLDMEIQGTTSSQPGVERTWVMNSFPMPGENGIPAGVITAVLEITHRRKTEEQRRILESRILQSQKMESLGLLAGGVAHDFNNLLMGIMGNAELAAQQLPSNSAATTNLEEIRLISLRAAELANQMLAYSGKGKFIIRRMNLNELVHEMGQLLRASISKNVEITYDLANNLPAVEIDVPQWRQVAMNLVTNAAEAIGTNNGTVTIRTLLVELDGGLIVSHALGQDLPPGVYVCLEVSDTGCGMDSKTQNCIFDPFFTTKFTGRGLGLAAVLGIVRGHHGAIKIASKIGKGTTFQVYLPPCDKPAETCDVPAASVSSGWKSSGTVLVVDDEPTVLNVCRLFLKECGFNVLTACDGMEAVNVFRQNAPQIAAVLLDLTMPHMNGRQALEHIRRIRPDTKVILTSGYSEQEAIHQFADSRLAGFIQKPFELDRFVGKFREIFET